MRLRGSWVPSQGRGQSHELQVESVVVLGPSDAAVCCLMQIDPLVRYDAYPELRLSLFKRSIRPQST